MKSNIKCLVVVIAMGMGLMMPMKSAFADFYDLESLTAQWWQWALSIPTSVNPLLENQIPGQTPDPVGECVIGQHGSIWFLAGYFNGATKVTRTCSVPQGTSLFFPVINSVNINTPGICGQVGNISAKDLRASIAGWIDAATNLLVTVDHKKFVNFLRIKSNVFEVALPKNNVFWNSGNSCTPPAPPLEGIYSPSVDDGYYMMLDPLKVGQHTLHIHAESPAGTVVQDITYSITVVPVLLK